MAVKTEPQVYRYLKAPLAPYMKGRRLTVRDLAHKVSTSKRQVSRSTIGYLRKHTDRTVSDELAAALVDELDVPYSILFVEKSSNVQREVAPKGRAA